jgi:drug/metabolite transporter (DMT)-like permease
LGIFLCIIAIIFFTTMYLLLGQSQKRSVEPMGLNLAAFLTGTLISSVLLVPFSWSLFPGRLVLVGSGIGLTAGLGLLATTLAVRNGIPVSVVNGVVSLCLVLPVLLSSLLYKEIPSLRKCFGIVLAAISIVFIQKERSSG